MNKLTIITNENLDFDKVKALLKKSFPNKEVKDEKQNYLFLGKFPTEFILELNIDDYFDNPEYAFSQETIDLIPFKNKYCNDISYHSFTIIKNVVKILLDLYPEMWIYDDDYLWIGSAKDFILSNHQEPNSGYVSPNHPSLLK
jgi:hypothetical protein